MFYGHVEMVKNENNKMIESSRKKEEMIKNLKI